MALTSVYFAKSVLNYKKVTLKNNDVVEYNAKTATAKSDHTMYLKYLMIKRLFINVFDYNFQNEIFSLQKSKA